MTALLRDHFVLMTFLAALIAAFLSFLWRDSARERRKFFLTLLFALLGGAIALGWFMYAAPDP